MAFELLVGPMAVVVPALEVADFAASAILTLKQRCRDLNISCSS